MENHEYHSGGEAFVVFRDILTSSSPLGLGDKEAKIKLMGQN